MAIDVNQTIKNYEGWLHKMAGQITTPDDISHEDLVQEGRVAMWHALSSYNPAKGSLPSWLTLKARHRMTEVATGKRLTGQPSRLHGRYSADEPHLLSLDVPRGEDVTLAETVPDPSNPIERAEMARHRGEIAAARRKLTPAQQHYIEARFYAQLTDREMVMAGIFSYDPHSLWTSPKNGARGKLADDLAHLRDECC